MEDEHYYIYIMTNKTNLVLYTGVTSDLVKRVYEHRAKAVYSFTSRYNVTKLVYYEVADDKDSAVEREKQIKSGSRQKKLDLIAAMNPGWEDLAGQL